MISQMVKSLFLLLCFMGSVFSFLPSYPFSSQYPSSSCYPMTMSLQDDMDIGSMTKEDYLSTLPEDIKKMKGPFEMCYVERIEPPQKTSKGLYVPLADDEATMQTVRIVMVGDGEVGESGTQTPIDGLTGKQGHIAHTKQPFGIGPRDDTVNGRKFSFVRNRDILAVVE